MTIIFVVRIQVVSLHVPFPCRYKNQGGFFLSISSAEDDGGWEKCKKWSNLLVECGGQVSCIMFTITWVSGHR